MRTATFGFGARHSFALAVLLALGACGSGGGGSDTITPPAPFAYAYVASAGASPSATGAIYEYGLFADSSVSPLPQASIAAGAYPAAVVVGQGSVYVVNVGDGTISQYIAASDGTLTPMNPAAVTNPGMRTLGAAPASATIDPTGSFLYVTNAADNTLSQFGIGSDGQLTALTPPTVATGVNPVAIVAAPAAGTTPRYYVINSAAPGDTGTVSLYSSGENGTLTLLDSGTVAAGKNPSAIAVNNAYSTVYVVSNCDDAQCNGSVRQFAVGAGDTLTDTGATVSTGSHFDAVDMVINQDAVHVSTYVLSNAIGADNTSSALWQYGVESTGELAPASPPMLTIGPVAVAQFIRVNSLYVLTTNSGSDASTASTGGTINFYSLGTGGEATLTASPKITAPRPVTMDAQFLPAP